MEFLLEIEEIQDRELEEKGVRQWAEDEFSTILQKGIEGKRRKDPWRGVSNINALGSDRRALAIVRELWQAREQVAMELDLAPGLVLKDETIIALALKKPKNEKEFKETGAEERVRAEKMGELDSLFDHYIPCQRRIKPKIWKGFSTDLRGLRKRGTAT